MAPKDLLDEIKVEFAETARWTGRSAPSSQVMTALAKVPREVFVRESEIGRAYDNTALPIGHQQTISQPFIVALMTELLDIRSHHSVLEIGTGSGYQAAVLAEIAAGVFTIEKVPELAQRAEDTLQRLGYRNVAMRVGDGALGWAECGPYDGIIVTAGAMEIPKALIAQLRAGGRMVIPLGPSGEQMLTTVTKTRSGAIRRQPTIQVAFVPFVSGTLAHDKDAADRPAPRGQPHAV